MTAVPAAGAKGHPDESAEYLEDTPATEPNEELAELVRETAGCYQPGETARMPPEDVNESMIVLEDAIEDGVAADGACYALSSRTGNGLKELNYYVHERDAFLERFNAALAGQPRFPIEMTLYHDPEWQELQLTRAKFDEAEG